jgi:uncharacterized membrane protein
METTLVFLHTLGIVGLLGGLLSEVKNKNKEIAQMVVHGSWTLLVTGLLLVAIQEPEVNHPKIAIKLVLMLMVIGQIWYAKKKGVNEQLFWSITALGLVILAIGFFWQSPTL